jgi:DNA (cytosine-5)-methyltransferase 1
VDIILIACFANVRKTVNLVQDKDMEQRNSKRVAEFFAGIGLMRAGLEKAGWTICVANDIDSTKRKLYLNHFTESDGHFLLEDIHKLKASQIPNVDLATASFPCTDLSLAGRRAGLKGDHSSAFWGFVNILQEMGKRKPPYVLLENVTGFLTSNDGQDFEDALLALNELGYAVDAFIINASHFVPQSRARMFIIGKSVEYSRESKDILTKSEIRPDNLMRFIYNHPQINWSINTHLPSLPNINNNLSTIVEKIKKTSLLWFDKKRVDYLLNQTFERHLVKVLELKENKFYTYLTAFRRVRNGKSMAEIRFDGIAGCLRTPKGGSARQILLEVGKGEINIRLLTPIECSKLMGAGDFKLSGTVTEALFGLGDAVCVPVVAWIAENYLNSELYRYKKQVAQIPQYAKTA